jgi:hypothetical protein
VIRQTREVWRRFREPGAPMYALGVFGDERLLGIVHYLYHLST